MDRVKVAKVVAEELFRDWGVVYVAFAAAVAASGSWIFSVSGWPVYANFACGLLGFWWGGRSHKEMQQKKKGG